VRFIFAVCVAVCVAVGGAVVCCSVYGVAVRFLFLRFLCAAVCVAVSVECSVCSVLKGERVERERDE